MQQKELNEKQVSELNDLVSEYGSVGDFANSLATFTNAYLRIIVAVGQSDKSEILEIVGRAADPYELIEMFKILTGMRPYSTMLLSNNEPHQNKSEREEEEPKKEVKESNVVHEGLKDLFNFAAPDEWIEILGDISDTLFAALDDYEGETVKDQIYQVRLLQKFFQSIRIG